MSNQDERMSRISIGEGDFLFVVAGQLYSQAPNKEPRKADVIMNKVRDKFREKCQCVMDYNFIEVPENELGKMINDILFSIPEFEELNLSHVEYHTGVKVSDDRPPFAFTSAYDKTNWKHDFIDLDAFINNVERRLLIIKDGESDCFGCKHEGTDNCNGCSRQSKLTDNYEDDREPRDGYSFACKYDCMKGCYICCEECKARETCEHRCKKCSKDCGFAINQNNEN